MENAERLELLRKPFEHHQISKLPKQAKWMTDKKDEYTNCNVCGGYHHPKATHLDYVGHAALTDRLLECDPLWDWEPVSFEQNGSPHLDQNGGLWIKLTVCGVSRYGYGHADGKRGGDAVKESIGDALRNAAMRFGAALDLWHKGDLHLDSKEDIEAEVKAKEAERKSKEQLDKSKAVALEIQKHLRELRKLNNATDVIRYVGENPIKNMSQEQIEFFDCELKKIHSQLSQPPAQQAAE